MPPAHFLDRPVKTVAAVIVGLGEETYVIRREHRV
jgi:hypothetical protein